eukprot:COSAG02_NODE_117_length_35386_cov_78.819163_26_plen_74_part_00
MHDCLCGIDKARRNVLRVCMRMALPPSGDVGIDCDVIRSTCVALDEYTCIDAQCQHVKFAIHLLIRRYDGCWT